MRSADRIEQEMQGMRDSTKVSQKRAALTSQGQETQHDRAARYFETHGLSKMNLMLGLHSSEAVAPSIAMHEEADDDEDYHKQWAAADALRLKRPAAVA